MAGITQDAAGFNTWFLRIISDNGMSDGERQDNLAVWARVLDRASELSEAARNAPNEAPEAEPDSDVATGARVTSSAITAAMGGVYINGVGASSGANDYGYTSLQGQPLSSDSSIEDLREVLYRYGGSDGEIGGPVEASIREATSEELASLARLSDEVAARAPAGIGSIVDGANNGATVAETLAEFVDQQDAAGGQSIFEWLSENSGSILDAVTGRAVVVPEDTGAALDGEVDAAAGAGEGEAGVEAGGEAGAEAAAGGEGGEAFTLDGLSSDELLEWIANRQSHFRANASSIVEAHRAASGAVASGAEIAGDGSGLVAGVSSEEEAVNIASRFSGVGAEAAIAEATATEGGIELGALATARAAGGALLRAVPVIGNLLTVGYLGYEVWKNWDHIKEVGIKGLIGEGIDSLAQDFTIGQNPQSLRDFSNLNFSLSQHLMKAQAEMAREYQEGTITAGQYMMFTTATGSSMNNVYSMMNNVFQTTVGSAHTTLALMGFATYGSFQRTALSFLDAGESGYIRAAETTLGLPESSGILRHPGGSQYSDFLGTLDFDAYSQMDFEDANALRGKPPAERGAYYLYARNFLSFGQEAGVITDGTTFHRILQESTHYSDLNSYVNGLDQWWGTNYGGSNQYGRNASVAGPIGSNGLPFGSNDAEDSNGGAGSGGGGNPPSQGDVLQDPTDTIDVEIDANGNVVPGGGSGGGTGDGSGLKEVLQFLHHNPGLSDNPSKRARTGYSGVSNTRAVAASINSQYANFYIGSGDERGDGVFRTPLRLTPW